MGLKNILIKSVTLQFIFFLLFSQILIAQNTFHGTIKSEDGQPITSASVILKDSIGKILTYTFSDNLGKYSLKKDKMGKFILSVTSIGFEKKEIEVDTSQKQTKIDIELFSKSVEIQEIVINSKRSITVDGDKIIFDAQSFSLGNEEVIEDLLKKIPGLKVSSDGTIKVGNQEVEKVMINNDDMFDKGLIERLQGVLKESFVRLPYTEGIKILEEAVAKGHKFEFPVYWGVDLASEHERYLVEDHFKRPVILTDYPKEIKAFYMKQNEDGKTVRAMDVLFPKIGEIIGGSERESDYNKLMTRIDELHIPMKDMWWYLDTRKFGTCPHSGFGLGFERLLLFVTGMTNIRDVIPFPRTPRNAEF